jgi:hypothetical protein
VALPSRPVIAVRRDGGDARVSMPQLLRAVEPSANLATLLRKLLR